MNNEPIGANLPPEPVPQPLQPQIEIVETPRFKPVVTYTILVITVLIWLLQIGTKYMLGTDIPGALGLKVNDAIVAGQYWRLFTPMLLHDDVLPLHILFNMYFLAIVGAQLERFTGHGRFLVLYILTGFSGNVFSFLFSADAAWGASTALFGLMAAQAVFVLQNRRFLAGNGTRALQNILTLIALNVVLGIAFGADNWGHVGGLAGGAAFGWFGGVKLGLEEIAAPRFRLVDLRGWREELLGATLVAVVFGGFAALKILGIAF